MRRLVEQPIPNFEPYVQLEESIDTDEPTIENQPPIEESIIDAVASPIDLLANPPNYESMIIAVAAPLASHPPIDESMIGAVAHPLLTGTNDTPNDESMISAIADPLLTDPLANQPVKNEFSVVPDIEADNIIGNLFNASPFTPFDDEVEICVLGSMPKPLALDPHQEIDQTQIKREDILSGAMPFIQNVSFSLINCKYSFFK